MGENLSLWLFPFLSSLVTRRWDLPSPNLGKLCLSLKEDIKLTEISEMVKDMSESSPREGIQRFYQGKFLSMMVSPGMSFLRKRWCCATDPNSTHTWWELPCGFTHLKRFWHVFPWAVWHSSGESNFCWIWTPWWASPQWRTSGRTFYPLEEIPSQKNCRKDQFNPKETSQQDPDNLPLKANKSLNKNENPKKNNNLTEPISNPTTYNK